MRVWIQEEVMGAWSFDSAVFPSSWDVRRFNASGDWRSRVNAMEADSQDGQPLVCFVSLPVARHIRAHCSRLNHGLFLRPDVMRASVLNGALASHGDLLLNHDAVFLPFGRLAQARDRLFSWFGPRLFMKPDSGMKVFPAVVVDQDSFEREISFLSQTSRPSPEEMVLVSQARSLDPFEFRCWCVQGEVVSVAPYAFGSHGVHPTLPVPEVPPEAVMTATLAAMAFMPWEDVVVVDVGCEAGRFRVVECNAFSTSGFYPGFDVVAAVTALVEAVW